jgi:hypothetical protein
MDHSPKLPQFKYPAIPPWALLPENYWSPHLDRHGHSYPKHERAEDSQSRCRNDNVSCSF